MELSYILIFTMPYDGTWIEGVVKNLDEALEFFLNKTSNEESDDKTSNEELDDNYKDDYYAYFVEVWNGTKKICTYKFNMSTKLLDKLI